jgi:hypothetical protein
MPPKLDAYWANCIRPFAPRKRFLPTSTYAIRPYESACQDEYLALTLLI